MKHAISFILANYSWAWGLPWSMVHIPSIAPLEKTKFVLDFFCLVVFYLFVLCLDSEDMKWHG